MKKSLERLLNHRLYICLIMLLSFLIWSYRYYVDAAHILNLTMYSFFILTVPLAAILIFYENTIYSVPILLSLLFSVGVADLGVNSLEVSLVAFLNIFVVIIGMIIHVVKFKPKLKLGFIGLSLILASISFFIPLIYTQVTSVAVFLAFLLPLYLIFYLFYANTIKGDQLHYLMRTFAGIGVMLSFQLFALITSGFSDWRFITDMGNIGHISVDSPNWGNTNDLTIQLTLTACVVIYYLFKYPKSILPWLYLGWIGFWIYLSDARGSIITVTLFAFLIVAYVLFKKDKRQLINLGITTALLIIFAIIFFPLVQMIFNSLFSSIDLNNPNSMLSGRLTLWVDHEFSAWNEFLRYPLFGRGWYTEPWFLSNQDRITIYHSTFFQVLATGGLFGIGILVYHFIKVGKLFKMHIKKIAVLAFLLTYLLTQLHGLVDNTQYMVHYSMVTFIAFSVIENDPFIKEDFLPSLASKNMSTD